MKQGNTMLGVCIGTGDWQEVAYSAARRMECMTGIICTVWKEELPQCCHPSWQKAFVAHSFPHDSFMVFDADIVCLKPWEPESLFKSLGRPFMAVPDTRTRAVLEECESLGIPFPDCLVNGGLTIFGREHQPVWDSVWARHPKCGRWLEQGALNLALLEQGVQICRLPRRFNWVTHRGAVAPGELEAQGVINLHATSMGSASALRDLQRSYGLYL